MDIELKNQSVVEIGKAVGDNVNSMIPQSQALVPAGATAPAVEPMPMNPFDSMMAVLEDVRDGVYALVDKFSDSVSLQQDQIRDDAMAQDLAQVGGGEDVAPPIDDAGGDDRSFLQKSKDKISELMGAGGLKGMLIKGGLIFGLLGLAKFLQKFGREIAETIVAIKDGIENGYNNVKDFFTVTIPEKFEEFVQGAKDFFTITVPEKIEEMEPEKVQLITDSITTWFTDIVTEVKGIFTKVKDFFVITVPTKVQEIKDSITTWFTNIKDEVVGLFTKAKDFVVVTVPEKMAEISKGISDKFTEIKDQIIDFAMAPFRKIGELFDNLLIGILESVENIPFIGGKAKEMKEAIIAKRETAAAEGEVNQIETGNLIDYGFDNNNNLTMNGDPVVMGTNSDAKQVAVAAINDGTLKEDEAQIVPTEDGFMVKRIVPATIEQGDTTTGGATGGELNNTGAEFVGAGNPTGGGSVNVVNEGAKVNTVSANQTHMSEDTGTNDKNARLDLYD
jgi:hypothetical protein